jgi:hypothetical protein
MEFSASVGQGEFGLQSMIAMMANKASLRRQEWWQE